MQAMVTHKQVNIKISGHVGVCILLCGGSGDEQSPEKPRDSGERRVSCVQNPWIQASKQD